MEAGDYHSGDQGPMGPAVGECYADPAYHWVFWLTHPASCPLASGPDPLPQSRHYGETLPDEPRRRQKAREVIKNGKLPARSPDRTWGGPGIGAHARSED